MEAVKQSELVTLVNIALNHPTLQGESMIMTFVFDRQPQAQDIMLAYETDNFLKRHPHFRDYGPVLHQCLNTFGVPQRGQIQMQDPNGWQIQTPMLTARWFANLMGPKESMHNHEFGFIRVYYKPINIAHRDEPAKVPAQAAKSKRGPTTSGLPKTDKKTGLEKSPRPRRRSEVVGKESK